MHDYRINNGQVIVVRIITVIYDIHFDTAFEMAFEMTVINGGYVRVRQSQRSWQSQDWGPRSDPTIFCPNLAVLDLSENALSSLTTQVGQLNQLAELKVVNNKQLKEVQSFGFIVVLKESRQYNSSHLTLLHFVVCRLGS